MRRNQKDSLIERRERLKWYRELTDDAIDKRTKKMEFHGLEEVLRTYQLALLDSYNQSKDIKHPRDKGDQREEILRRFFTNYGLIPAKYFIPSVSTRVISPTGHISPELDILFVNADDSIVLKKYPDVLEYYPIESSIGTIQVKSKFDKKTLLEGLDNIKKFKMLKPIRSLDRKIGGMTLSTGLYRRFGILFAYENSLSWDQIYELLKEYSKNCPSFLLPNIIISLDSGSFVYGDENRYGWDQKILEEIENPKLYSFPDDAGHCLQQFYCNLIELLVSSNSGTPNVNDYLKMPMTAGEHSYIFNFGPSGDLENCEQHGSYLKTIKEANIEKILDEIDTVEPINWIRAHDLARGESGEDVERYEKQPGDVRIYNPDNRALAQILMKEGGFVTHETVVIDGLTIWLPWCYVDEEQLLEDCPKCMALETRRIRRKESSRADAAN